VTVRHSQTTRAASDILPLYQISPHVQKLYLTPSFQTVITSTSQDTPSPATSTFATSSAAPSNLAVIGTFKFFGCLGSVAGYPSFDLIGEGPDMTTAECARLGGGRAYIGIYQR
jgi:hypothetical protein